MKVIKHSEQVLRVALISKDAQLVKLYEMFEPKEKLLLNEAFQPESALFKPITLHCDSDWISSHPEPTQDFAQFYHDPCRNIPSPQRNRIYVQPIGHLLNYLKKRKPKDAFCIVGITMIDLYPKDSWNFVFGQASLTEGMGIFSFARYDSDFYSTKYRGILKTTKKLHPADYSVFDGYYTPDITSKLLLRSCKTLTHEIGHIFGLHHCQWLQCVMQGSNHLEESDRRPIDLCPICLRKLHSSLGFNLMQRYKALQRWIEEDTNETEAGLSNEARSGLKKPVEAFKESYDWIAKCLDLLEK
ncbi:archaemetzincin-2 isoform X2 [Varanus komodoensis]|uniref:archaemetzincin-2 isoform X2 n=1 Tax=Varanus komodoensis TaxID=61221 RepID=UPI001CF771EC|nr:archaemetzincin-2 isoform X2 [Varanus komodoensis]